MRVGAKFGEGAVVDRQFGVTDVFVVMPINEIEGRYIEYFGSRRRFGAQSCLNACEFRNKNPRRRGFLPFGRDQERC